MQAVSIHPNYSDSICAGLKTAECRSRMTNYRGDLLICATNKNDPAWQNMFIAGHAICIVDLYDCQPWSKKYIKAAYLDEPPTDGFVWLMCNVRPIKPVPVIGKQGMFNVDIDPEFVDLKGDDLIDYWISLGLINQDA